MVDWGAAFTVALSGIISVFAVLILLQISVQATSWVVTSLNKKSQEKSKATN
ncbi:MAG: OadG family transporter subunit [Desulfotomaculaceae bacterium]